MGKDGMALPPITGLCLAAAVAQMEGRTRSIFRRPSTWRRRM